MIGNTNRLKHNGTSMQFKITGECGNLYLIRSMDGKIETECTQAFWHRHDTTQWILTTNELPGIGANVETSEDGINAEGTADYLERRTCMMAGSAGGYGYFGEGFATDGTDGTDYGLIIDPPKYWRPV